MKMQKWWSIEFDGDIFEFRSDEIGREALLCNGEVVDKRFNLTSKGSYNVQTRSHGECELRFALVSSSAGATYTIEIVDGDTVLAEYHESIEELLPKWLRSKEESVAEAETRPPERRWKTLLSIVAQLGVALIVWGLVFSWATAPVLILVLLFHEAGHYLVMVIAGYRNRRLVILPPLGMAVTGEKPGSSDWERFWLYMAGPIPGIVLAFGLTVAFGWPDGGSVLDEIVLMLLGLNYFNLLPIQPLDGGKIVETMFLKKLPVAQVILTALGAAGLGVLSIVLRDGILGILVVAMVGLLAARVRELRTPAKDAGRQHSSPEEFPPETHARWYHRTAAAVLYLGTWAVALIPLIFR